MIQRLLLVLVTVYLCSENLSAQQAKKGEGGGVTWMAHIGFNRVAERYPEFYPFKVNSGYIGVAPRNGGFPSGILMRETLKEVYWVDGVPGTSEVILVDKEDATRTQKQMRYRGYTFAFGGGNKLRGYLAIEARNFVKVGYDSLTTDGVQYYFLTSHVEKESWSGAGLLVSYKTENLDIFAKATLGFGPTYALALPEGTNIWNEIFGQANLHWRPKKMNILGDNGIDGFKTYIGFGLTACRYGIYPGKPAVEELGGFISFAPVFALDASGVKIAGDLSLRAGVSYSFAEHAASALIGLHLTFDKRSASEDTYVEL